VRHGNFEFDALFREILHFGVDVKESQEFQSFAEIAFSLTSLWLLQPFA